VLKVVLDTNQLVSSLLSTRGVQAQLVDEWRRRTFVLFLAPGQVEEVDDVLRRPKITKKYSVTASDRQALLELLRTEGIALPQARRPGVCRDPDDDYLLGCAATGGIDYLVTGDEDLLTIGEFRGVRIVDGRHLLDLLST